MTIPSKSQVFEYWKERILERGFFIDWGEPSCWACGEFWNGKYDVNDTNASYRKILSAWEKAPLQRCHIVPVSLGGTEDESNLFLMCKQCHDLAPNTLFPEIFFQWSRNQNHIERLYQGIRQCQKYFGISEKLLSELLEISGTKELGKFINIHAGLHWPQSGYSGLGRKLTPSTLVGLLLCYYKNESDKT